jgi:hypothetical protein
MVFGDDAAAGPAGHHAEAEVQQLAQWRARIPGAAAHPQHRPPAGQHPLGQLVEFGCTRRRDR